MKSELNIRTVMSKDALPVTGAEQAVHALVDITAGSRSPAGGMPADLALVLDRSGSMDGVKLERLKEAVGALVDRLGDQDRLSVTVFDDLVETIVPGQAVRDRGSIRSAIARVMARGGTQISDGLKAGLAELRRNSDAGRIRRILLLTDGRTWDDEAACVAVADEAGGEGVAITAIGIGEDWNEQLLLQLAERSRGNSHWIEDPNAIADVFRQEVDSAQAVAAVNVRLVARLSHGVRPVRVYTTVPMISDVTARAIANNAVETELGSLDGGEGQKLLIELRLPAQKEGPFRIGHVEATFDIPSQGITGRSVKQDLAVTFTPDTAAASRVNAEVMNLAEKVSAFKLQTRALTEVQAGNILGATKKLRSAATVLLNLGEDDLAAAVEKEVRALTRTGSLTSAGTKKLEYGTRKLTQALK